MKRFLVFRSDYYYPGGGWEDFVGDFDTLADARKIEASVSSHEWAHVVDTKGMRIVPPDAVQ